MAHIDRYKLYSRLVDPQSCPVTHEAIRQILSYWDPRERITHTFYNDEGWFLSGFWDFVMDGLMKRRIVVSAYEEPQFPRAREVTAGCKSMEEVYEALRDWQQWAVCRLATAISGIAKFPTRFGKSYTIAGVYRAQGNPTTLVVVPTKEILDQAVTEITEFLNEQVGKIGDGVIDIRRLTFATAQSLVDLTQASVAWPPIREKLRPYLESVETIAWDEIQQHGTMFVSISEACVNAAHRHGYSATPFTGRVWWDASAIGFIGPLIAQMPSKDLADRGGIEHASCFFWRFDNKPEGDHRDWTVFYKDNIVRNEQRNLLIARIANDYVNQGKSVLVFAEHVEHLRKLSKLIPGSEMLAAKLKEQYKRRKEIKADFNSGKLKCVIVTKVWRMGVTLYADAAINAGGQKQGELGQNELQMLGRGLMPKGAVFHWNDLFDEAGYQFQLGTMGKHSMNRMRACLDENWPVHLINRDYTATEVTSMQQAETIILPDCTKDAR